MLKNYEFDERADVLIDGWAGDIFDAAREPELYRFITKVVAEHDADPFMDSPADLPSVVKAAAWFNRINLKPQLPQLVLDEVTARAWADAKAQTINPKPPAGEAGEPDISTGKRACIRFDPAQLTAAADEAELAMLNDMTAERVFSHGGSYATVRRAAAASVREYQTGETGAAIVHYDEPALRERLMASTDFYTWRERGKGEWRKDKAPDDLVRTLRSRHGGVAPVLIGTLSTPTVCPDGRLVDRPGYDCHTGLYSVFANGEFPAIREYRREYVQKDAAGKAIDTVPGEAALAEAAAKAAHAWLAKDWLGEFSFKDRLDESAAIAALITGLVRKTCGLAPGFLPSSPQQSTGKTTLMLAIGAAVEGAPPALNDWPDDEAEMNKVVFAALRDGRSILAFDNLPNGAVVRSRTIARLLSAETIEGRVLGQSTMSAVPAASLVMLTGNNLALEGDMPSRVVEIYLDAQTERPEDRVFKRDILAWTIEHRGDIVSKALTIVKAYLDAGAPAVGAPATRFATWDRMVRRAIVWAGGEDLAAKFVAASQADPVTAQLQDILNGWEAALGQEPLTSGDIVAKINTGEFNADGGAFREALLAVVGHRPGGRVESKAVGLRLKSFANRLVGCRRIVSRYDGHRKQHLWSIERVETTRISG